MKTAKRPPAWKASKTSFCVTLPVDLLRRLDAVVARKISSRSRETRDALLAHLEREEGARP